MLSRQDRDAIEELFVRLEEVEYRGGPRDVEAEALIRQKIARQPAAPYYLAQTVVVQQEALKAAERRIAELEMEQRAQRQRGPWDGNGAPERQQYGGGGFLGGAAQTALGVAGGMMLGSLIGSIFSPGSAQAAESAPADNSATEGNDPGFDDGGGFDGGGFDGGFDIGGDF